MQMPYLAAMSSLVSVDLVHLSIRCDQDAAALWVLAHLPQLQSLGLTGAMGYETDPGRYRNYSYFYCAFGNPDAAIKVRLHVCRLTSNFGFSQSFMYFQAPHPSLVGFSLHCTSARK